METSKFWKRFWTGFFMSSYMIIIAFMTPGMEVQYAEWSYKLAFIVFGSTIFVIALILFLWLLFKKMKLTTFLDNVSEFWSDYGHGGYA
jgi:hypothetical protein